MFRGRRAHAAAETGALNDNTVDGATSPRPFVKFIQRRVRRLPLLYLIIAAAVFVFQRSLLYVPTHQAWRGELQPWTEDGRVIGYFRQRGPPRAVWLLTQGNGGQAEDRAYALPCFAASDAVYVLEYPGYGLRPGSPSKDVFNGAAAEAYRLLRQKFPGKPVCVIGESIGTGVACFLASQSPPPDKIVLVVPFDRLASAAWDHYPFVPVRWLLKDNWDNVAALAGYRGPVEIFGSRDDAIIKIRHARALAAALPLAKFHEISGGHNDWARTGEVIVRYP